MARPSPPSEAAIDAQETGGLPPVFLLALIQEARQIAVAVVCASKRPVQGCIAGPDENLRNHRLMLASTTRIATLMAAICTAWMISGWSPWLLFYTRYDDARALEIIVLMVLLSVGVAARSFPSLPRIGFRCLALVALIAFFALGVVSALRSGFPVYGLAEVAMLLSLTLAVCVIRQARAQAVDENLRTHVLTLIALGGLVLGFRHLFDLCAALKTGDIRWLLFSWQPFSQQRYLAKAAGLALPLLWVLPRLPLRHAAIMLVPSAIASIMISSQLVSTGSRGVLLGLLASVAVAALLFRRVGRSYALWQLGCLLAGLALWLGIENWGGFSRSFRIIAADSSGRDVLYGHLLDDIRSAPWLGIGPMQFSVFDRHPDIGIAGPHSLPLQIAAEWGLPALTLVLSIAACWSLGYLKYIRNLGAQMPARADDARIETALFMMLLIAGIHSLVANVLNDPVSQLAIVMALGLTRSMQSAATRPVDRSTVASSVGLVLAASCVVGLGWSVRAGTPCYLKVSGAERLSGADGLMHPRLWSQGLIPFSRSCALDSAQSTPDDPP